MNVRDIQQRIQALFEQGAQDGLGQVVVWFDPAGEFTEVPAQLELPGVEVLVEETNRLFELKRRLNAALPGGNVLLYRQRGEGDLHNNWLADVEMYATPFKADYLSMLMADLGVADTPPMRAAVGACRAWLGKKTHVKRVRELGPQGFATPKALYLAVMAVALGKDVPCDATHVAAAFLAQQHAAQLEARAQGQAEAGAASDVSDAPTTTAGPEAQLRAAGVFDQLSGLLTAFGCADTELEQPECLRRGVLLRALVAGLPDTARTRLASLGQLGCDARALAACREVARVWKARDAQGYARAACEMERSCKLSDVLADVPLADLVACEALPCIDELVLHGLLVQVTQTGFDADAAIALAAQRAPLAWGAEYLAYYEALDAAAKMRRFERDCAAGFFRERASEVWQGYQKQWWRMDSWYRGFHRAAARAVKSPVPVLDDALKEVMRFMDGLYKGWFLTGLERAWEQAAGADLATQGYVSDVPRQELFYMNEVAPLAKRGSVFVVVSDALRYEVACELADALERKTQGKADLDCMQAVFPSITKCGMAALLPHGNLGLTVAPEGVRVLADGLPCASTPERQALLQRASEGAVAVQYGEFMAMRKDERKQLVGAARVVYVYHDQVDAVGDSAKTECDVFDACDEAVEELVGLVRVITGELRCSNVVVTADHGFLYTYEPLGEQEKVAAGQIAGEVVEKGRRYVLAAPGSTCEALAPVSMRPFGSNLAGFSPRACLRVAKPGSGQNFVHGGISPQELCVPVLRFKNLRANARDFEAARPSALELLTSSTTVTANIFSRDFFQVEPVGGKVVAASYEVALVDDAGTPVTSTAAMCADKASEVREDRRLRVTLTMRPGVQTSAGKVYRLQVRNAQTGEVALEREQRVDIAFGQEDFGW